MFASTLTHLLSAAHLIRPSRPAPPRPARLTHAAPSPVIERASGDEMPLTVWEVDTAECSEWDAFVRGHPHGTLFHTLAWRSAGQNRSGRLGRGNHENERATPSAAAVRPIYLAAMRGERIVAAFPLLMYTREGGSACLASLPNCPMAGLLTSDAPAVRLIWERLIGLARSRQVSEITWTSYTPAASLPRAPLGPAWTRLPWPLACGLGPAPSRAVDPVDQRRGNKSSEAALRTTSGEAVLHTTLAAADPQALAELAGADPVVSAWQSEFGGLTLIRRSNDDAHAREYGRECGRALAAWGVWRDELFVFQAEVSSLAQTRRILTHVCQSAGRAAPRHVHLMLPDGAWILRQEWMKSPEVLIAQTHHVDL